MIFNQSLLVLINIPLEFNESLLKGIIIIQRIIILSSNNKWILIYKGAPL